MVSHNVQNSLPSADESPFAGGTSLARAINSITCPACSLLCDDLQVTVENGAIASVKPACHLGQKRWRRGEAIRELESTVPLADMNGNACEVEAVIERAREILTKSRYPLIYGLAQETTAAQRAAVALAERYRGAIDVSGPAAGNPVTLAMQQVGMATCTLGEVKNRADVVVFWNCDPATTHPRLVERCAAKADGRFLSHEGANRKLIVVDAEPTATADSADTFYNVAISDQLAALDALRLAVRTSLEPTSATPASDETWLHLAASLREARYGVLFFSAHGWPAALATRMAESLLQLVAELNAHTRFSAIPLPLQPNAVGAANVLAWQTGFPMQVDFSAGYPRYAPGEATGQRLLERGEADACLLIGEDAVAGFSAEALAQIEKIPTIVVAPADVKLAWTPEVRFRTALSGLHTAGTAYRLDGIALPLRALLPTGYASTADVLERMLS